MDRVLHEYRLIEYGFRDLRPKNSLFQAGVRESIPKVPLEQEKPHVDLFKLPLDQLALKDISRIETLAKRKSRYITKELIEKNIASPIQATINPD
jgi:hypothetical protein